MNEVIGRVGRGGAAGFVATLPMSLVMLAMHRRLPWWERHSLPPHKITRHFSHRVGMKNSLGETGQVAASVVSHFGYGAAAGAAYATIAEKGRLPGYAKGIVFGLFVWAASYQGWLPAARILRPVAEHAPRRTTMMIVAHIVWGLWVGLVDEKLAREH